MSFSRRALLKASVASTALGGLGAPLVARAQAAEFAGIAGSGMQDEDLIAQAISSGKDAPEVTLAKLPGDLKPLEGESGVSSFSGPICDLILAVFELDKKNNWLRRQAIVIILQQVLGGTIERRVFIFYPVSTAH